MSINATLLGQMITFSLFVWFTMAFVWPPIIKALQERKIKIAEGLAAAERGEREWQDAKRKGADVLKDAREHAQQIIIEAQKRATVIEQEAQTKAKEVYTHILNKAEEDRQEYQREAKEELRQQFVSVVMAAVEKIVAREVDNSTHKAFLKKMAEEL